MTSRNHASHRASHRDFLLQLCIGIYRNTIYLHCVLFDEVVLFRLTGAHNENWPLPLCGLLNPFFLSSSYTPEPCTNKPFPGTDGDEG